MQDYKASYILTKSEMLFLLSSMPEQQPSYPTGYAINKYLQDSVPSQDTVEGLIGKKLARKTIGMISVEPVVDLLVKSALSAITLWELKSEEAKIQAVILRSNDLYLYVTRYKYIDDNWKITPFQDREKLKCELDELLIGEVVQIDNKGNQIVITPKNNNLWIEGDSNG